MRWCLPQKELEWLEDLISYLAYQRESRKPVCDLQRTLKDLKVLIRRIVINYYLPLNADDRRRFLEDVSSFLREIHARMLEDDFDKAFCEYLLEQVQNAFGDVDGIREGILLDNFDFKLRPLFKAIRTEAP